MKIQKAKTGLSWLFAPLITPLIAPLLALQMGACQTPQQEVRIVKKQGGGFSLDQIKYCADSACEFSEQGFETRLRKNNILLIYLDLRNTGDLNLVSRIQDGYISSARLIVKSQSGWVMARVPINLKEIKYKIVQEVEFKAVPYSISNSDGNATDGEREATESLETEKVILEPFRNITEESHFGDHDVIPQAIPLTLNSDSYRIDAVIYMEFELTTSTVNKERAPPTSTGGKGSGGSTSADNPMEINELSMLLTNLATPPFSFTILR